MGDGHTEYQPDTLARPVGCHMNGGHIYFKHLYLKKLHLHVRLVGLHGLNCILAQVWITMLFSILIETYKGAFLFIL